MALDDIIGESEKKTPPQPSSEAQKAAEEAKKLEDEELKKKEEHKQNLDKAIAEANETLRKKRENIKMVDSVLNPESKEELPKIDMEDPGSKAWDKHISDKVSPLQADLDKEKEEVRTFALREFLSDKPALAKSPEKVKELMGIYDKIKTASERTREGVLLDLNKSYAAVFHEDLISAARQVRIEKAQNDILFSDIAVSRGATTYTNPPERIPQLSEDDRSVLAKWGMTAEDWIQMVKEKKSSESAQ